MSKTRTRRKLLSILLTLCMVLCQLPTVALAAEPTFTWKVQVGGKNITDGGYYKISSASMTTGSETDYNARWDAATDTLYLNGGTFPSGSSNDGWFKAGVLIEEDGGYEGSPAMRDVNIVLSGENTVTGGGESNSSQNMGLQVGRWDKLGTCTIKGSGTLIATGGWSGTEIKGDLLVEDSAKVTFKNTYYQDMAMAVRGSLTVSDTATVTAEAPDYATYLNGSIEVGSNASFIAKVGIGTGNRETKSAIIAASNSTGLASASFQYSTDSGSSWLDGGRFVLKSGMGTYNDETNFYTSSLSDGSTLATWVKFSNISINTVAQTKYSITGDLTNVTSSATLPAEVNSGSDFTTTLSALTSYILPDSITVGGVTLTGVESDGDGSANYYNKNTGKVFIYNVTAPVTITATASTQGGSGSGGGSVSSSPGWNADGTVYTPSKLENGSFEEGVTYNNTIFAIEDTIPGWSTTSLSNGGWPSIPTDKYVIEVPSTGESNYFGYGLSGASKTTATAQSGNRFAELNAQKVGALYQDVVTIPGEVIRWSLYHHCRSGVSDTMQVCVGNAMVDGSLRTKENTKGKMPLQSNVYTGSDTTPSITNGQITTNCPASLDLATTSPYGWVEYWGYYTVPEGQTLTRFSFESVSSGSGNATEGNLLDNITFQTMLSAPKLTVSDTTVTVKTYCTMNDVTSLKYSLNDGSPLTLNCTKSGAYLTGDITDLPIGSHTVKVWVDGYADYAASATVGVGKEIAGTLTDLTANPTLPAYVASGANFTTTLSAVSGHILPDSITVGGITLTGVESDGDGSANYYNKNTGKLFIYNVTAPVTIAAAAPEQPPTHSISGSLTDVASSATLPAEVNSGSDFTTILSALTGYILPNSITVGSETLNGVTSDGAGDANYYNKASGKLFIKNVTANTTITAVGLPAHTITFNGNGATPTPSSKVVGDNMPIGTLPIVTKTNSEFLGWYDAMGNLYTADTLMPTCNLTLTAQWAGIGGEAAAGYTKMPIYGYNEDVIASVTGINAINTVSEGANQYYAFFNQTADGVGYVPPSEVISIFQMGTDNVNNSLRLATGESGTLLLGAQNTFDKLAVLWANADSSSGSVTATVNYTDGTSDTFSRTVPAWTDNTDSTRIDTSISAVKIKTGGDTYRVGAIADGFGLYKTELAVDPTKTVEDVNFDSVSTNTYINVLAISGWRVASAAPASAVSGIQFFNKTNNSFDFSWNAVNDASYYLVTVKKGDTPLSDYNEKVFIAGNNSAALTGLSGGSTYTVEVTAANAAGQADKTTASIATVSSDGYITDENEVMRYMNKGSSFDIQGNYAGEWKKVTYSNAGFYTYLNENAISVAENLASATATDGLKVAFDFAFCDDGKTLQINYKVQNTSAENKTFSLATGADVMIGADDRANITVFDGGTGFKMVSSNSSDMDANGAYAQFNFFGKSTIDVTDVDSFWTGHYSSWKTNKYISGENDVTNTDSGAVWSWQGETIAANETKTYSVKIGIGGAGSETAAPGYFGKLTSLPSTLTLNQGDYTGLLGDSSTATKSGVNIVIKAGETILTSPTDYELSDLDTTSPKITLKNSDNLEDVLTTNGPNITVQITVPVEEGEEQPINNGQPITIVKVLPIQAPADTLSGGVAYNTDRTGQMRYQYLQRGTDMYNFDVHGMFNGEWKQTTYANAGYETYAKVGSGSTDRVSTNGDAKELTDGLTMAVNLALTSDGKAVKVIYTLANTSDDTKTVSFGSGADIKIGSDDAAVINQTDGKSAFSMTSNRSSDINTLTGDHAQFRFYGDNTDSTYGADITTVDTFWYGHWHGNSTPNWVNDKEAATFYDGTTSGQTRESGAFDSAASWSWQDEAISAGAVKTYTVLIGVGGIMSTSSNLPVWVQAAGLTDDDVIWSDETDTLTFIDNVTLSGIIVVPENMGDVTFDLSGSAITGPAGAPAILVPGDGEITIFDDSTPSGTLTGGGGVVMETPHPNDNDYTTVGGFTYENNTSGNDPTNDGSPAIQSNGNGDINVDGAGINGGDGVGDGDGAPGIQTEGDGDINVDNANINGGDNGTGGGHADGIQSAGSVNTSGAAIQGGYVTAGNMQYKQGANSFDIQGKFDGSMKSTTYANAGYFTYISIDGTVYGPLAADGEVHNIGDTGITAKIALTGASIDTDNSLVKVVYTIGESTSGATTGKTIRMGTGADVKIGGDDSAVIVPFTSTSGFSMTSNRDVSTDGDHAQFNFYGDDAFEGAAPDVTGFWYGHWYDTDKYWAGKGDEAAFYGKTDSTSGRFDSAASWHWDNVTAGDYSVLIGVSGVVQNADRNNDDLPLWAAAAGLTEDDVDWNDDTNTLTFNGDVVLDNTITIPDDEDVVIDLNGHDITGPIGGPAIRIVEGDTDPDSDVNLEIKDSIGGGSLTGGDGADEDANPISGGESGGSKNRDSGFTRDGQPAIDIGDGIIMPVVISGGLTINGGDGDDADSNSNGNGGNGGDAIRTSGGDITIETTAPANPPVINGGDGGKGDGTGDGGNGGSAVESDGNGDVVVNDGDLNGGSGGDGGSTGNGGNGGNAVGSNGDGDVVVNDGDLNGGNGGNGDSTGNGGNGGNAVESDGTGTVDLNGGELIGGGGGNGGSTGNGGNGGDGLNNNGGNITIDSNTETPATPIIRGGSGGSGDIGGGGGDGVTNSGEGSITVTNNNGDTGNTENAPVISGGNGGTGDNGGGGNGGNGLNNNSSGSVTIKNTNPSDNDTRPVINGGDGGNGGNAGDGGNGGNAVESNGFGDVVIDNGDIDGGEGGNGDGTGNGGNGGNAVDSTGDSDVDLNGGDLNGGGGGNGGSTGNGGSGGDGVNNTGGNITIDTTTPEAGPFINGGNGGNGDAGGNGGDGVTNDGSGTINITNNSDSVSADVTAPVIGGGNGGTGDSGNGGDGGNGLDNNGTGEVTITNTNSDNNGSTPAINGGSGGTGGSTGAGGTGGNGVIGNVTMNSGDIGGGSGGTGGNGGNGGSGVTGNVNGGNGAISGGNGGTGTGTGSNSGAGGNGGSGVVGDVTGGSSSISGGDGGDSSSNTGGTGGTGVTSGTNSGTGTVTIGTGGGLYVDPNPAPSGDGGSGSGSSTNTTTGTASAQINGKTENIGEIKTETTTDGNKITTITVDKNKFDQTLNKVGSGSTVKLTIPENAGNATIEIESGSLENMADKNLGLTIEKDNTTLTVSPEAINVGEIKEELDVPENEDVSISIGVTPADETEAAQIKAAIEATGAELVTNPVQIGVSASYNGKSLNVKHFNSVASYKIEVTAEQAARITTAVVTEDDNTLRHIPTYVIQENDKYYAIVNAFAPSTCSLIYNETNFKDTLGKWYEDVVSEMASRKIINGRDENTFDGDANITRVEFAAIVVRAFGLPTDGTCEFNDIEENEWYYGTVGTAYEYGIIAGRSAEIFDPKAPITRQEAMQMIYNASKVANYTGATSELKTFADGSDVSSWAQPAASFNVGSDLIIGNKGKLNPKENITRAETSTVVLRLLQQAGLVDIRTQI